MLLDNFLPVYDFNEAHATVVHAPPSRIFDAIKELTPAEVPLLRTLFALRLLPARLVGSGGARFIRTQPLLPQMLDAGFVLLAEATDREIVFGRIGQFWKVSGGASPHITDGQEFLAFDQPEYAKAALNFSVDEHLRNAGVTVSTETRIAVPDPVTRRKFAIYWRVIYPGSALIRRMWLRAIKRRAERG